MGGGEVRALAVGDPISALCATSPHFSMLCRLASFFTGPVVGKQAAGNCQALGCPPPLFQSDDTGGIHYQTFPALPVLLQRDNSSLIAHRPVD